MLALGAVGFLLLSTLIGWVVLIAVPLAFATGWAWLGSYNLAMVKLNPVAPGAAVGVTQTGAFVGAIVGPAGLGFLAERLSFTAVWVTAAIASLGGGHHLRAATVPVARACPARASGDRTVDDGPVNAEGAR